MTRENELPRDVEALLALIGKERAVHEAERESLLAKVASLEHRVQVLSRWAFGPRSEKRVVERPSPGRRRSSISCCRVRKHSGSRTRRACTAR